MQSELKPTIPNGPEQCRDGDDALLSYAARPVTESIRMIVDRSPNEIAVHYPETITYESLYSAAMSVSQALVESGVTKGDYVVVWTRCPVEAVLGSLGALLAGAAFIPIDEKTPVERVRVIVEDSAARIVVAAPSHIDKLAQVTRVAAITIAQTKSAHSGVTHSANLPKVSLDDIVYVIYTSGSTGTPKGVAVTHGNLASFVFARNEQLGLAPRIIPILPFSFDPGTGAVFWALATGGSLSLLSTEQLLDFPLVAQLVATHRIRLLDAAPQVYFDFLLAVEHDKLHSLETVLVGGEALSNRVAKQHYAVLPQVQLVNEYGPTEATVYCTAYVVPSSPPDPIPIGKPIANAQCYVVDSNGALCSAGQPGELYVGGSGVAWGYLNRPELTSERFVPDVFSGRQGARVYRTGDLARVNERGEFEFLGRMDSQIKLRGNRIELGEIEHALTHTANIYAAAVLLKSPENRQPFLVGFYVSSDGEPIKDLRSKLGKTLPIYMIPSYLVHMSELPRHASGKIDRNALARLPLPTTEVSSASDPPQNELELELADIWADVLSIPEESINRSDDFFALGGHSLLLAAVRSRISEHLGIHTPVSLLFSKTVLFALAEELNQLSAQGPAPSVDENEYSTSIPVAPIQETFYYLAKLDPESAAYVEGATLRIRGALDKERLRNAVSSIVADVEILRSRIDVISGSPVIVKGNVETVEECFDWSEVVAADGVHFEEVIDGFVKRPIAIDRAPLIRFLLINVNSDVHYLTLAAHHIVFDGISVNLFFTELWNRYRGFESDPRNKHVSNYRQFAISSRQSLSGSRLEELYSFWKRRLGDGAIPTSVPHTYVRHARHEPTARDTQIIHSLSPELTQSIRTFSRAHHVTPFMATLAAMGVVMGRYSGDDDIVMGTPVSLRGLGDFDVTIGCIINTAILRFRTPSEKGSFLELLAEVKTAVIDTITHAELPISWLIHELSFLRERDRNLALFSFFFNYIDWTGPADSVEGLSIEPVMDSRPIPKFDLTMYVHDWGGHTDLQLVFDPRLYDKESMLTLGIQLESVLTQAIHAPSLPLQSIRLQEPSCTHRVSENAPSPSSKATVHRIHEGFSRQARQTPNAIAISFCHGKCTYAELAGRAATVVSTLRNNGLCRGDRIAIYAAREPSLVACLIGSFEAECICAVIDPDQPEQYTKSVFEILQPKVILDPNSLLKTTEYGERLLQGERIVTPAPHGSLAETYVDNDPDAYALFTSGTTGLPKGILGTHAPVVHFLTWQADTFAFTDTDRFAMLSGLGHDPLLRDIFAPLSIGARLCIPSSHERIEPQALASWLSRNEISVLHMTPGMEEVLSAAKGAHLPTIRYVFFGGDRLRFAHVNSMRQYSPRARFFNCYGLSETPQIMSICEVNATIPLASLPIGQGIDGVEMTLEDAAGESCAPNELGEIVIRSSYLAKGYIEGSETRPFATTDHGVSTFYTGDLGRWDAHGRLHFVRRKDRQVKVRGYRIDPEYVEAILLTAPGINRASVLPHVIGEDLTLEAFVVAADAHDKNEVALREFLRARLMEAAVPRRIVFVDEFPLTPNGKIDHRALLASTDRPELDARPKREAMTQTEERVMQVCAEVLNLPSIDVESDFFNLGGTSILAVQILSRLGEDFSTVLPLELLIRNPTPATFAEALIARRHGAEEPLVIKVNEAGSCPPFWMLHPIGGHVLFIRRFALSLGQEQPVFGIQAQGVDGVKKPIDDLRAMAALYIEQIRRHQPQGPYFIGGPSFGGRIAYEIAQQLISHGETVAMLAMFDTWGPGFPKRLRFDRWVFEKIIEYATGWRGILLRRLREELSGKAGSANPSRYRVLNQTEHDDRQLSQSIRAVIAANERASQQYRFRKYRGCISLFRASVCPKWVGVEFSDPTNGWARLADSVHVSNIDCTHQDIMDEPALSELIREFKKRLHECRVREHYSRQSN